MPIALLFGSNLSSSRAGYQVTPPLPEKGPPPAASPADPRSPFISALSGPQLWSGSAQGSHMAAFLATPKPRWGVPDSTQVRQAARAQCRALSGALRARMHRGGSCAGASVPKRRGGGVGVRWEGEGRLSRRELGTSHVPSAPCPSS